MNKMGTRVFPSDLNSYCFAAQNQSFSWPLFAYISIRYALGLVWRQTRYLFYFLKYCSLWYTFLIAIGVWIMCTCSFISCEIWFGSTAPMLLTYCNYCIGSILGTYEIWYLSDFRQANQRRARVELVACAVYNRVQVYVTLHRQADAIWSCCWINN